MNQTKYILYWMQAAQRSSCNEALNKAIALANEGQLPLLIVFCLDDQVPDATRRHYHFMLEGLFELAQSLDRESLKLYLDIGQATTLIPRLAQEAAALVTDRGYLRWQRDARQQIYLEIGDLPYYEVETEPVIPILTASSKEEYAAATIRPKLCKLLSEHLFWPKQEKLQISVSVDSHLHDMAIFGSFPELWSWVLQRTQIEPDPGPVQSFRGGYSQAIKHLDSFISLNLERYHLKRGDPSLGIESGLSPYLHFGQISALEVTLRVLDQSGIPAAQLPGMIRNKADWEGLPAAVAAFCEELIIRRELSFNFCYHNPDYDSYLCLPAWARASLEKHEPDKRPLHYSLDRLVAAATNDVYWNAAQREMLETGKMHNYMRMYWGKKVLEWAPDPETAYYWLLWMNNRFELDGRDPNGYAGLAWCFGKHDRPWVERPIFGSIRYMNAAGLKRKFDMEAYVAKWMKNS